MYNRRWTLFYPPVYWTPWTLRVSSAVGRWTVIDGSRVQIPAGAHSRNVTSTQPRILPGSLNRVLASAGGKSGIHTSGGNSVLSNMTCEFPVAVKA